MDWAARLDDALAQQLPGLKMGREEPMSRHTSFRIGGPARRMAFPSSQEELVSLLILAREAGARPLVMGRGTNLLVPDQGVDRLVIDTSDSLTALSREGEQGLRADAGISLTRLADFACRNGLRGLEFAHGIPGTLGGGVCMNAGAYGGEMKQVLDTVTAFFPEEGVRTLSVEELDLQYRRSLFTERTDAVILGAALTLHPGDETEIRGQMNELMKRRRSSQPLEFPSAGSTFKRPAGGYAGTMIDQSGLKGLRVGGAEVSEKHAGFVINRGGATYADVTELIRQVQERVQERFGVLLEPEVRIVER